MLNEATQAWMEIEYNRAVHRETASTPVERFAHAPDVLRRSPSSESLRDAFRLETSRTQRQSDGTISLEGVRFEIPARYRHFRELTVRYARWNLGRVDLVDRRSGIASRSHLPARQNRQRRRPPRPGRGRRPADVPRGEQARQRRGDAAAFEADPPGVFRHGTAAGVPAQDTTFQHRRRLMNTKKLLALWGLKWNPFSPELPGEGLLVTPRIENFAWRVEQLVQEGGFALISGESGTGKSVALRIVAGRLPALRDVTVGVLERPQSKGCRLLSRAGRHLRGEAHAAQSLGRLQGAPRALEGPCGLVADPAGAADRRSPGDDPRSPGRAADSLQCRLRCHVAVDGGPRGRRAAPGTAAAGRCSCRWGPGSARGWSPRRPPARSCSSCSAMRS